MITLSEYSSRTKKITVALSESDSINLELNIGSLCRAERDKYFQNPDSDRAVKNYICSAVRKWDIMLTPETPAPINAETLDLFPDTVTEKIAEAISKAGQPSGEQKS